MNQIELSDADRRDLRRFAWSLGAAWAVGPWGYLAMWWGCKAWDEIAKDTRRHLESETVANILSKLRQGWNQDGR